MTIDLEALEVLDVVVKEGSFVKAAEKLGKAQSVISYQIKKLESQLGTAIFDRSQYRAELTHIGQSILQEGRRLLTQARHISSLAKQYDDGWEPRLEVVIDGALPLEPIMHSLKCLSEENVPTKIQVKVEFLAGVHYRFDKDQADFMLVKDYQHSHDLMATPLAEVEFVLVCADGFPLAGLDKVDLWQLHEHIELSVHDTSPKGHWNVDKEEFGGDRIFYLSDFYCKKQGILMGLGFGWMPVNLVAKELHEGLLQEVAYTAGSRYSYTPQMVQHIERPLGKAGKRLQDLLQKNCG